MSKEQPSQQDPASSIEPGEVGDPAKALKDARYVLEILWRAYVPKGTSDHKECRIALDALGAVLRPKPVLASQQAGSAAPKRTVREIVAEAIEGYKSGLVGGQMEFVSGAYDSGWAIGAQERAGQAGSAAVEPTEETLVHAYNEGARQKRGDHAAGLRAVYAIAAEPTLRSLLQNWLDAYADTVEGGEADPLVAASRAAVGSAAPPKHAGAGRQPAASWLLDTDAAELLKNTIGSDDTVSEVTLAVTRSPDGYGLHVWLTDYPEEGSILLVEDESREAPPAPALAADSYVLRLCSEHEHLKSFTWTATVSSPARYRCPICEPQEVAQGHQSERSETAKEKS